MTYYSPIQAWWMQQYAGNPMMLNMLRQAYSQVQTPDESAIEKEAQDKKNQYLSNNSAPQLARLMVQDGPNASSFAAARQAALASEGQRNADSVYYDARNNARDTAYQKYAQQTDQENRAFNGIFGYSNTAAPAYDGGGRLSATTSTGQKGISDRFIQGGSQALNYLGKQAYNSVQSGQNPFYQAGNAIGQTAKILYKAPTAIAGGLANAWGM